MTLYILCKFRPICLKTVTSWTMGPKPRIRERTRLSFVTTHYRLKGPSLLTGPCGLTAFFEFEFGSALSSDKHRMSYVTQLREQNDGEFISIYFNLCDVFTSGVSLKAQG